MIFLHAHDGFHAPFGACGQLSLRGVGVAGCRLLLCESSRFWCFACARAPRTAGACESQMTCFFLSARCPVFERMCGRYGVLMAGYLP